MPGASAEGKRSIEAGDAAALAGERDEARRRFSESLAIDERPAAADPDYRADLLAGHLRLGEVVLEGGRPAEAEQIYRCAYEIADDLHGCDLHAPACARAPRVSPAVRARWRQRLRAAITRKR